MPTVPASPTILRGILMMCLATAFFTSLDSATKYLTGHMPIMQIVWARYLVQLILMTAVLAPTWGWRLVRTGQPGAHALRGSVLLLAGGCMAYGYRFIPLADATAIFYASPLLIVLLSAPVLGERLGMPRIVAALVGFIGVLLVIRPGTGSFHPAALVVLLGAFCGTAYQLLSRRVGGDSAVTSLYLTAVYGTLGSSLVVPFFWIPPDSVSVAVLALLLLSGVIGGVGQFMLTRAYGIVPASILAPFGYTQLLWSTLSSWLLFGDAPHPLTLLGMAIIAGSGLYITYRESLSRRSRPG